MCRVESCLSMNSEILQVSTKFASSRRSGSELFFRKVPAELLPNIEIDCHENIFHRDSAGVHVPLAFGYYVQNWCEILLYYDPSVFETLKY